MSDERNIVEIAEQSARGGYYLFVGNTVATVILVLGSIIIARLFGPETYGLYSLLFVVPSLLIGLVDFGITSAITKFLADFKAKGRKSDVNYVIKSGLLLELAVGVIASIFCFIFSDTLATYIINTPEASGYIKITSVLVLFQTLFNTLSSIFIGLDNMENNAVMMIIRAVTKFLISISLILLGFSVFGAIIGHIACYVVAVGVGLAFLTFKLRKNREDHKASSGILNSMLKYGTPIYVSGLLGLFMSQYQIILIAFFASKAVIGNFQVTTLFSTAMTLMVYPLIALFPAFSKLDPKSEQLNQFFKRSVKYTALLLIPASIAIAMMSKDLVLAFYGPDYTLASTFVALYILTSLYAGFGSAVFPFLFNGIKRTDVTLKASLVTLIVFVPLAPLLTSLYGVIGLILAIFASGICSLIYLLLTAVKKINLSIDIVSSAKIYLASAISAFILFIFISASPFNGILNLIFGGAVFFFTYLTILPAIGVLNLTDIELFRQIFQKNKSLWHIVKLLLLYESKILNQMQKLKTS